MQARDGNKEHNRQQNNNESTDINSIDHAVVMIIDETGDPGKEIIKGDTLFAMTAVITERSGDIGHIARIFRTMLKVSELKARKTDETTRNTIIVALKELDPEICCVYIDKAAEDNPKWWVEHKNRKVVYRKIFFETVCEALSRVKKDNVKILVDKHKHLAGGIGEELVRCAAARNRKIIVGCSMENSQTGEQRDQLQTNDYVPYSVREKIVHGRPDNADRLDIKFKKLTKENVIEWGCPLGLSETSVRGAYGYTYYVEV
ncbi:MAG: hypothetical protein FWD37_02535 [Methanomassiliicoccaceae archaeon]|nr:hypothetical protein [Methanomassiliicoccaceae archaeon]